MPRFEDKQIGTIVDRLHTTFTDRDIRVALRNALTFRRHGEHQDSELGIAIVKPYDESQLVLQYMSGRLSDAAQHMTGALSRNDPLIEVTRLTAGDREVTEPVLKNSSSEEQILNGIYWSSQQSNKTNFQNDAAWSAVVEGAGWYISYPRDVGFALPDREFFTDRTDDEIAELTKTGKAMLVERDGEEKPAESADLWFKRRREASRAAAVDARALFHLEMASHGTVYWEDDDTGFSIGMVDVEVQSSLFDPDSKMAKLAARFLGDEAWASRGIVLDEKGRVIQGLPKGDMPNAKTPSGRDKFHFARIWTRTDVYYYVYGKTTPQTGKIIWHSPHSLGEVPFYPCYGSETHSRRPEERYLPLMDGEFAYTPLINQTATFLSAIAAVNAMGRWVIETKDGAFVPDPDNPTQPLVIERESVIGMDPNEVSVIHGGTLKQVRIEDGGFLLNTLQFFLSQEAPTLPSEAETGAGESAGPAWAIRLKQAGSTVQYEPAVKSHATSVAGMARMWARELRKLDEKLFFTSAPGKRGTRKNVRGLIEFDTSKMTDEVTVFQSPNTREEQIALRQAGISQRQAGFIDDLRMVEEFFSVPDALDYVLDFYAQAVLDATLTGPNDRVPEGSLLFDVAQSMRGVAINSLLEKSPAFAVAMAEFNVAQRGSQEGTDSFNRGAGGPMSEAVGFRAPGIGMGLDQNALPALEAGP